MKTFKEFLNESSKINESSPFSNIKEFKDFLSQNKEGERLNYNGEIQKDTTVLNVNSSKLTYIRNVGGDYELIDVFPKRFERFYLSGKMFKTLQKANI